MSEQPEQNKTAENNIDSVLLSSFPNQGTRFDSINDVISELGEFGYECVTEAMRKYASQQTASLQKQVEELREENERLKKYVKPVSIYIDRYPEETITNVYEAKEIKLAYGGDIEDVITAIRKALNPQDNQSKT